MFVFSLFFYCVVSLQAKDYSSLFTVEKTPLIGDPIITDSKKIIKIMEETADFLRKIKKHPSKFMTVTSGLFEKFGVTVEDVLETVEFIVTSGKKNPKLLQSPWFFNTYFTFYRWHGDPDVKVDAIPKGWARPPESIRTTQYRIIEVYASKTKNEVHCYPIYQVPNDEKNLTRAQVIQNKDSLLRFKFSRSEIVMGKLEQKTGSQPLAWVTDQDRKEFSLQGSALFVFDDGKKELLRVAGNNGMKGSEEYWFAEYVCKRKQTRFPIKVKPSADVTYAGDLDLLGFGKVIALVCWNPQKQRKEIRLGVIVDTGSAFKKNLAKLDMFTGYFPDKHSFKDHTKGYPQTARAYILIKKK